LPFIRNKFDNLKHQKQIFDQKECFNAATIITTQLCRLSPVQLQTIMTTVVGKDTAPLQNFSSSSVCQTWTRIIYIHT